MHLIVGDDSGAARATTSELLDGSATSDSGTERIDVAEQGVGALLAAVGSPSLFGGRRSIVVDGIAGLTDADAQKLMDVGAGSDALVIARAASLRPKLSKTLSAGATVHAVKLPSRPGEIAGWVRATARREGVTLDGRATQVLAERVGHDPDRVRSILWQLRAGGVAKVTERHITALAGTSERETAVWEVTDALERGDLAQALRAARRTEPLGVIGYLCTQMQIYGQVCDHSCQSVAEVTALTGRKGRSAEKALGAARRLGRHGVGACWDELLKADRACKGGNREAAVDAALVRMADIYQRG